MPTFCYIQNGSCLLLGLQFYSLSLHRFAVKLPHGDRNLASRNTARSAKADS